MLLKGRMKIRMGGEERWMGSMERRMWIDD